MDTFSRSQRSEIMRRVRSKGTRPEALVRSIVRKLGVKYRSCVHNLPGKPDLAIAEQRKVILVHGCFWHDYQGEAGKPLNRIALAGKTGRSRMRYGSRMDEV